jgi:predicted NBD/HSP70 family sugar kinase
MNASMSNYTESDRDSSSFEGEYTDAVLKIVENRAGVSRASIARHLGLSRTTSSTIVSRLIGLNLLEEKNPIREGRGRPGILLDLDSSRWRALGAEFHSGHWSFVETDLKGRIIRTASRAVAGADPETFLAALVEGMDEFKAGASGELLPAIGVGAPGLVDCDRGTIIRADDLGWKDVSVAELVERQLGMKVLLINRNRAAGLAEARFGAGRGVHQMVYIGVGTGISAAFVVDGQLLHGTSFSAGEIGHIAMDKTGPLCACGKRGCLHVYASGSALGRRAAELVAGGETSILIRVSERGHIFTGEEVCSAAALGDKVALESLVEGAAWLGLAVANIITTYNPDKIIIGGPLGLIAGPLLDMIRIEASRWAMQHPFKDVAIERGALGESVGAFGAACLVLDRKLNLTVRALEKKEP